LVVYRARAVPAEGVQTVTVPRLLLGLLAGVAVFALVFVGISPVVPQSLGSGLIGFLAGALVTGRVAGAHSLGQWALAALLLLALVVAVSVTIIVLFLRSFT